MKSLFTKPLSNVGQLAENLGLPVTPYRVPEIHWKRPLWLILCLPILYIAVFEVLRNALHLSETNRRRKNIGWFSIAFVIFFVRILISPFLWGSQSSGSKVVDFALAVIAFVLSLRIYRITFMRPVTDTSAWSVVEYYGRLFTFPTEYRDEKNSTTLHYGPSARWENGKDIGMASIKVFTSLFFIRCIPPPEAFADMSWTQQRVYYAVLGGILLVCLEGFVGGFFGAYGFTFNRHMRHMFNHPLISSGFRDLWANRWNLPVTDVLKNVIFRGVSFPISQYFHESHRAKSKSEYRKRTFRQNAEAAFLTFLVSGLFHEVMSYMAFGDFRWANVKYFSWNAIGCSIEVLLEHRLYPDYARIKHTYLFRAIFMMCWAYGSEVYTDGYLMFGFFEEAKVWIGLLFPWFKVQEVVWLPLIGKPVRGHW